MDKVMQTKVDVIDATKTYYGESQPGTATTAPNWRIRRALTTGGLVETNFPVPENTYGYPSSRYAFRWSDRAILNYTDSRDITTATLSTVTIASNNTDTTKAKVGDIVTLTIIASEALATISATIAGHAATIVAGADDAHYTATYTMVTGDTTGVVPFTIDFTDNAGNAGTQVTAVTGGASVTFDKTAPTATITYSASTVKSGDTLTITATFSEPLLDSPVVKIAIAGSNTVAATVMTKSTTQIYTYSHTVAAGNGASTVSLSVGTDTAGNIVTAAPTSGATFTVDNTLAVFTGVSVLSNNANTARAKSGDIVTAIFTTSEALQANPTVTFGAQAMTFGTLV